MSATTWSKFYWADWRSEPSIRMVSLAARGLWIEMLSLMGEASPRGYLLVKGKQPTIEQIASMVGAPVKQVKSLIAELEGAGTFDKLDDGTIISRRMVRDQARADAGREAVGKRQDRQQTPTRSPTRSAEDDLIVGSGNNQPPSSNSHLPVSDSEKDFGEDAGTGAASSGSSPESDRAQPPAVQMQHVKGGAKQFAGLSSRDRPKANPDKADQRLAQHMIEHGHLPAEQVWVMVMAARDPEHADHIDAARQCEKYSRTHKLGWFHEEAA